MSTTGVKFGTYHSFSDWGLQLKAIEKTEPSPKTVLIEVEGMDGVLDLTEAQNGCVRYGNRQVRFIFDKRHSNFRNWADLETEILNTIHGKKLNIIIDTENDYYYTGRCYLETSKNNEVISEFAITCNCEPYRTAVASVNGDWLWDPFSFRNGVIHKKKSYTIDSPSTWVEINVYGYKKNWGVSFTCTAAMEVKYNNVSYELASGTTLLEEIELEEGENALYIRGTGTMQVLAKGGAL